MDGDNENIREISKLLKERYNFRGLLHFTDFSNLNSIINIGYLLSRALCYAYDIEFFDVKDEDDYANDYVRFYFTEKNHEALYKLKTPVYLLFSEDLIALYLSVISNGAKEAAEIKQGFDFDFRKQTELLVAEPVSLKYLKNIIFRCKADYKRACNLYGKNKIYSIEPNIFFHGDNYVKDYDIYYDSAIHSDLFMLHFSTVFPVKNDINHEYRLYDLNDNLLKTAKIKFLESDSTDFNLEVKKPEQPVKFKLWFYGIICIEEIIGE